MNRTALILKKDEKDILFYSSRLWVKDALLRSGIEDIKEIDTEDLLSSIKENTNNEIFITFSDLALIDEEVIEGAFALLSASEKDVLVAKSPESGRFILLGKASALSDLIDKYGLDTERYPKENVAFSEFSSKVKFLSSNNPRELLEMNKIAAERIIERHAENGVIFLSQDGILISPEAEIKAGATILPGTIIKGKSIIEEGAQIGPNSLISDSVIGKGSEILSSHVLKSKVGSETTVGPFTQLRPDSVLGDKVHVGDFVEIKNSNIGDGTAVAHLTYVGDSDVGKNVNFGCGVVTVNYDGENKNRTRIGDYAFIGCNTNLVAPVSVGDKAYTAAGSTITKDVPSGALAIARSRQENKEDWADKKLSKYVDKKNKK